MYVFVDKFFIEMDAYDPGIELDYFFNHRRPPAGSPAIVANPGFGTVYPGGIIHDVPEFERVDYLTFEAERRGRETRPDHETPPAPPES